MPSREERERQARDALRQYQGLAQPWMIKGEEGIKVRRGSSGGKLAGATSGPSGGP